MSGVSRELGSLLELSAEVESFDLPHGEFIAKNGKAFKWLMTIGAIVATGFGLILLSTPNKDVGMLALVLGICLALTLPTNLSYRCTINKVSMKETYYLLFIKRQREIFWQDVKYRKVTGGYRNAIRLYDKNKKMLIAFDGTTVGFRRIVKMAKRGQIQELKKTK